MEPITLAAGALIALVSFGIGHLNGRRTRKRATPPAVCEGCGHGLSYHDNGGKCHGTDRRTKHNDSGQYLGQHDFPCTCQQYVGPIPADRLLASFISPPLPPAGDTTQH